MSHPENQIMENDITDSSESDVSYYSSDGEIPCSFTKQTQPPSTEIDEPPEFDEFAPITYFLAASEVKPSAETLSNRKGCVFPDLLLPKMACSVIETLTTSMQSFTYILSPAQIFADMTTLSVPQDIFCNVVMISPDRPVMVLTFATTVSDQVSLYNSCLARAITAAIRSRTFGNFHLVHGVIDEKSMALQGRVDELIHHFEKEARKTAIPGSMMMDKLYQRHLIQQFLDVASSPRLIPSFKDFLSTFVETTAFHAAKKQLQLGDFLILTGGPGEGKSAIAHRLCYDYHQQGYNTVYFSGDNAINWDVLTVTKPTLVVCDTGLEVTCRRYGRTRQNLMNLKMVSQKSENCDTLPKVDITEVCRSNIERTKQEYFQMLQTFTPEISENHTKEIITSLTVFVGFPRAVKLYKKYKRSVPPLTYFTYPIQYFIEQFEDIALKSNMEEWMFMLLYASSFEHVIDDKGKLMESVQQFFPKLPSALCIGEKIRQYIGSYVDGVLEGDKAYLYFIHPVIYDACLCVVDRKYPGFLWKYCEVVFEREEEDQSYIRIPKLTIFISRQNRHIHGTEDCREREAKNVQKLMNTR